MIPTPPLRLRNRLAETILSALTDDTARGELAADDFEWLGDARPDHAALVRTRARRASEALAACPPFGAVASLDEALAAAAVLFDAGLYFEVHELLETHWARSAGAERRALQGLIQIAVAFQHLANGNLAGARSLLADGGERLRAGRLPGLDVDGFAAAASIDPLFIPPFPRAV